VAGEGDALVAGGVSQTPSYLSCKSEDEVKAIFMKQIEVFVQKDVDFIIAEVTQCKHTLMHRRTHGHAGTRTQNNLYRMTMACSTLSMWRRRSGLCSC